MNNTAPPEQMVEAVAQDEAAQGSQVDDVTEGA